MSSLIDQLDQFFNEKMLRNISMVLLV